MFSRKINDNIFYSKEEDPPHRHTSDRIAAIDALRGFDMFWIIGGNKVLAAFILLFLNPLPRWLSSQFEHARWNGFSAWDLIMPLFLFIVGVSLPFSLGGRRERGDKRWRIYAKVIRRTAVLFVLGMIAQGHLLDFDLSKLNIFCNTLQAIACGYLVASIALLELPIKWQGALAGILLITYWLMMTNIPVPGHGAGILEPDINLAAYFDKMILGQFNDGTFYAWLLPCLTFSASVLLGVLAGHLLKSRRHDKTKCLCLVGAGASCLVAGEIWGMWFPVNNHIWSSSMVLWAGGWSYLLLALFFWLIEIKGFKRWSFPFIVIGMNAIAVYMATMLIDFSQISNSLVNGLARHFGVFRHFIMVFSTFLLIWLILLYLYNKKTFIRI